MKWWNRAFENKHVKMLNNMSCKRRMCAKNEKRANALKNEKLRCHWFYNLNCRPPSNPNQRVNTYMNVKALYER